jgi:hypothetical protein
MVKIFKAWHHYKEIKGKDIIIPIADMEVSDEMFSRYKEIELPLIMDDIKSSEYPVEHNTKRVIEENTGVIKK